MGKVEKADGYGKWTYGSYKLGGEVFHVVSGGVLTKQAEVTAKARELGAVIPDDTAWHCERDESDQSGRLFYITGGYKLEDIALPIDIGPFYHRTRKLMLLRLLIPVGTLIGLVGSVVGIKPVAPAIAQVIILGSCAFFCSIAFPFSIGFCCAMVSHSIIDDTGAEVFGYLQAPLSKELSVRCRSLLNKIGIHVRQAPKGWTVVDKDHIAREHAGTPTAVTREQWIDAIDEQVESWFESPLVTTRMVTPTIVSEPTVSPASVSDAVNRILPDTPVGDTLASLSPSELETTMKRVRSL